MVTKSLFKIFFDKINLKMHIGMNNFVKCLICVCHLDMAIANKAVKVRISDHLNSILCNFFIIFGHINLEMLKSI